MLHLNKAAIVTVLCVAGFTLLPAEAVLITQQISVEYSGAYAPEGPAPWLTVRFDDGGASGTVTLTFEATNLVGSEFVSNLYLNVAGVDPSSLIFADPIKTGSFDAPTVSLGTDLFSAAGNHMFDIRLEFTKGGGASKCFGPGDALSYTISGPSSLTAASFNALSSSGTGAGLAVAAHVQGIGQSGAYSGWVTLPEPCTLSLLGLTVAGGLRRRRL